MVAWSFLSTSVLTINKEEYRFSEDAETTAYDSCQVVGRREVRGADNIPSTRNFSDDYLSQPQIYSTGGLRPPSPNQAAEKINSPFTLTPQVPVALSP